MTHSFPTRRSSDLLYAPAAPEFFDKSLFRGFIQKLRELRLVWPDENSKLLFDERLAAWARDAKVILGRELRHTLEKNSPEDIARKSAVQGKSESVRVKHGGRSTRKNKIDIRH